jgi:hypothetical protein
MDETQGDVVKPPRRRKRGAKSRVSSSEARTKQNKTVVQGERLGHAVGDASRRLAKESAKYVRGMSSAYLEGYRLLSESWSAMASEIERRQQQQQGKNESLRDLLWQLPSHAMAGYSKAVGESVVIPRRMVDTFYKNYTSSAK